MTAAAVASPEGGRAVFSAMMGEIGRKSTGWHAMVVMLSRLPVGDKRTALSTQMVGVLNTHITLPHGTLVLPNRDVLALVRDASGESLAGTIDVAAQALASANLDPHPLIRRFDLATELSLFIAAVSGVDMGKSQRFSTSEDEKKAAPAAPAAPVFPWEVEEFLVVPKDIAKIEKTFFKANVVNFIRNQTAYRLVGANELEESHDEVFISIDYLLKFFANKNISNDKWLFQYFTRTLDSRILSALGGSHEGEHKTVAYSVNLNVSSLFSEDFLLYDQALPPRVRRGQIIELQAFDVIENIAELPFLLAFFKGRGYRMCVDGVDAELFDLIDWPNLEVDMVKVQWSPDCAQAGDDFAAKVRGLTKGGKVEVVLCRCEDEAALDWGASVGIPVYQGWYLDGLRKSRDPAQPKPRYKLRDRDLIY